MTILSVASSLYWTTVIWCVMYGRRWSIRPHCKSTGLLAAARYRQKHYITGKDRIETCNYKTLCCWNCIYIVPLDMKGCICHFVKWQIHPFISKGTIWFLEGFRLIEITLNLMKYFVVDAQLIQFFEILICLFFIIMNIFSSFEAGNCVSNSSYKWMKIDNKQLSSTVSIMWKEDNSRKTERTR